jgi:Skp family chaperone for outer membrane proteins
MNFRPGWIAAAIVAAVLIGAAARPLAVSPVEPQGTTPVSAPPQASMKIGVVNLKQCFEPKRYRRIPDAETEYKAFVMTLQEEIDELRKHERTLEAEFKIIPPEMNKLQEEKLQEIQVVKFKIEYTAKLNQQRAMGKYQAIQMDIYNGIRAVVDQFGKDNGFDLIIKVDEPKLEEDSPESVSRRISTRPVLYANPALDITDKIIDQLNAIYKK